MAVPKRTGVGDPNFTRPDIANHPGINEKMEPKKQLDGEYVCHSESPIFMKQPETIAVSIPTFACRRSARVAKWNENNFAEVSDNYRAFIQTSRSRT